MKNLRYYFFSLATFFIVGCNSSDTVFTQSVAPPGPTVALSWTASSGSPQGYLIEQSTDGNKFTQVKSVVGANTTNLSGLTAATSYYFRIRAYNQGGNSSYSTVVSITTPALAKAK